MVHFELMSWGIKHGMMHKYKLVEDSVVPLFNKYHPLWR